MKHYEIPDVTFRVSPRNRSPEWLVKKKDRLEGKWNRDRYGRRFIGKIIKTCNLSFPSRVVNDGIEVVISKYSSKKHGDLVGSVSPTEPMSISLFARRKDTCMKAGSLI
jgi:hypothetical protein